MRKIKATFILLIMIVSFSSVLLNTKAEIVDTNDEENPISTNVQENSFIWNNRAFVFYSNGVNMVYKSRTNFTSWSSEISIRAATDGAYFSVWLEEDGTSGYLHYAYTAKTLTDENVYYRKGQLLPDGTISWSAGEQTIMWADPQRYDGYTYNPYVATDSSGYPIIVAAYFSPSNGGSQTFRTWMRRSSTKGGTWNTDLVYQWWSFEESDNPDWAWSVNKIIPIQSKKFHVISITPLGANSDYYYDGTTWSMTESPLSGDYASTTNRFLWGAVAENGNDVIHVVYNRYLPPLPPYFFQHKKWNSSGWFYVSPKFDGVGAYEWSQSVLPTLSLNSNDNTMRATWLEYNGTTFLNNTIWYRDWNGTTWSTPAVWYIETDDIIEHEDFTSTYSSDTYWAVCYITNATSKNVEILYTPPLIPPPPQEYYDVEIYIRVNGYEPYTNLTFSIEGTDYANGQTASLYSDVYGDPHDLDGTPVTHLSFINWTVTGSLTITNSTDPTTSLFVSGTGTLTLHLNATVAITHDETTITNMNADTWLFSEYRYYNFQTEYILTNSYLDTAQWSFMDFALHNITFYYNNATTEAILSGSNYILLRGNGTYTYSWINLTDQTLTVSVWVWIKHYIIDTMYVDLYVYANCTGYGMTNSTDGWVTARSDYFNLYAQGGAEELTIGEVYGGMIEVSSAAAGRTSGGDIFNLYAYNNTFALSEQYWRHLVQVKVLFEFKWDYGYAGGYPWDSPSADFPIDLHYQLGWTYYARGNWCENRFSRIDLTLRGFGYGADHQFSKWDIKIVHGGVQVYDDTLFGWFDEASDSYKVWMDLWFNSANASSIAGARATSYWYGVENSALWWARAFTGNDWGIMYENQTSHLAFGMLRDEDVYADRIFSSEIELVKLWCRVYQGATAYNYSASIWKIEIFDKVYDPHTMGIPTPVFEPPRTPSMPIGGFLGVIYAALMWIAEQLGAGALTFWRVFVDFMDTVFTWAGWPGGFTTIIMWIQSSTGWMIDSFGYLISMLTSAFSFLTEVGGKSVSFLSQVITQWIAMFKIFIGFLDGAYTAGINVWNDLGLTNWLILGVILYPIYLVILWDEEGLDAVISQLKFFMDILAMVGQGFISIIQLGLHLVSTLVEAIPVIE